MAATPPGPDSVHRTDRAGAGPAVGDPVRTDPVRTDLIVVGGGPAGCAAALTAGSVGMRSVLVEPAALCGKLRHIPALDNVAGGHRTGPDLAAAITADIARTPLCEVRLGVRATHIAAGQDDVTVTLDSGDRLTAPFAVVATGVGPLPPERAGWLTLAAGAEPPALWGASPPAAAGLLLVLGADRPLGTFLRAHPERATEVLVACPREDDYKAEEVRGDPRVTVLPVARLMLTHCEASGAVTAEWTDRTGRTETFRAAAAYLNLGSAPAPPPGALVSGADTYCPPGRQHPRVLVAGDLRSARFQRIMTATGSGAEAALRAYYVAQGLSVPAAL
jgi:thioredoxin reductase (NADPH)/alkyl hydroperoxide reductase subunit F